MKQKHYYFFGKEMQNKMNGYSLNEENWNLLRNDEADGPFSIEKTVEAYENNCKKAASYEGVAKIIVQELEKKKDTNKLVSLGIGKGILEWHLKNIAPHLRVECTDYTSEALEKLKKVFLEMDDGYKFDMLNDDYSKLGTDACIIMNRVSTEFDFEQWNNIFKKMYDCGIESVIYIPAGLDTKKEMIRERLGHIRKILTGQKDVFCGWLYSEDEFLKFFKGKGKKALYIVDNKIPFENTAVYFLSRNME